MPTWNRQTILELARGFMAPCVLAAGVKLDVFNAIGHSAKAADQLAGELKADARALTVLLDALAAQGLLAKQADLYQVPPEVLDALGNRDDSGLPLIRHTVNLLARWAALDKVVRTGRPAADPTDYTPGPAALAAFIGAMNRLAGTQADQIVRRLPVGSAKRLLDVGGADGTYAVAFCRAYPGLAVTVFDRPEVIQMARARVAQAALAGRIRLVEGDFYVNDLPGGHDAAWLSAIIHQNSRPQNRRLFAKIHAALSPGGWVYIRDHVMDPSHTRPPSGAMFAVNMLTGTEGGSTYSFDEIAQDLQHAGFRDVELLDGESENELPRRRQDVDIAPSQRRRSRISIEAQAEPGM